MGEPIFPSNQELREYIENNQRATIYDICNRFNQTGEETWAIRKPDCVEKALIFARYINGDFIPILQNFLQQDFVELQKDPVSFLVSNPHFIINNRQQEDVPLVISVTNN